MLSYHLNLRVSLLPTEENTCILYPEISLADKALASYRYDKHLSALGNIAGKVSPDAISLELFFAEKKIKVNFGHLEIGKTTGYPIKLKSYPIDSNIAITLQLYGNKKKTDNCQSFIIHNIAEMPTDYALIIHYYHIKLTKLIDSDVLNSNKKDEINAFIHDVNSVLADISTANHPNINTFIQLFNRFTQQFNEKENTNITSKQINSGFNFFIDAKNLQLHVCRSKTEQSATQTNSQTLQIVTPHVNLVTVPEDMPLLILSESLNKSKKQIETFALALTNSHTLPSQLQTLMLSIQPSKNSFASDVKKILLETHELTKNYRPDKQDRDITFPLTDAALTYLGKTTSANIYVTNSCYTIPVYDFKKTFMKKCRFNDSNPLQLCMLILALTLRQYVKKLKANEEPAIYLYRGIDNKGIEFSWVVYSTTQDRKDRKKPVYVIFSNNQELLSYNIRDKSELDQLKKYFLTKLNLPGILGEICDDFGILATGLHKNRKEISSGLLNTLSNDDEKILENKSLVDKMSCAVMKNPVYIEDIKGNFYIYDEKIIKAWLEEKKYSNSVEDPYTRIQYKENNLYSFVGQKRYDRYPADAAYNEALRLLNLIQYYKSRSTPRSAETQTSWLALLKENKLDIKLFHIETVNALLHDISLATSNTEVYDCAIDKSLITANDPVSKANRTQTQTTNWWHKTSCLFWGKLAKVKPLDTTQYSAKSEQTKAIARISLINTIIGTKEQYYSIWCMCGVSMFSTSREAIVTSRASYKAIEEIMNDINNNERSFDQIFSKVICYLRSGNKKGRWLAGKESNHGHYTRNNGPSMKHLLVQNILTMLLKKNKVNSSIHLITNTELDSPIEYSLDVTQSQVGGCHIAGLITYLENECKRQFGFGKDSNEQNDTISPNVS